MNDDDLTRYEFECECNGEIPMEQTKPTACESCGHKTTELFKVGGGTYCTECQLEAEAAALENVDYSDYD